MGKGTGFGKTILIGDPNIVDVLERSDRSVILEPLNVGATNVIFLDQGSIAIANVRIRVCKTAASPVANRPDPDGVCPVRNVERGTL